MTSNVWATRPIEEAPSVRLVNWCIMQTETGERHFVGYNIDDREGRVSSAIQAFDLENRTGVTKTGRVYKLSAEPGYDTDAMYTWDAWCRINKVVSFEDVTDEVLSVATRKTLPR